MKKTTTSSAPPSSLKAKKTPASSSTIKRIRPALTLADLPQQEQDKITQVVEKLVQVNKELEEQKEKSRQDREDFEKRLSVNLSIIEDKMRSKDEQITSLEAK